MIHSHLIDIVRACLTSGCTEERALFVAEEGNVVFCLLNLLECGRRRKEGKKENERRVKKKKKGGRREP